MLNPEKKINCFPTGWLWSLKQARLYWKKPHRVHHAELPVETMYRADHRVHHRQAWRILRHQLKLTLLRLLHGRLGQIRTSLQGFKAELQEWPPGSYPHKAGHGWTRRRATASLEKNIMVKGSQYGAWTYIPEQFQAYLKDRTMSVNLSTASHNEHDDEIVKGGRPSLPVGAEYREQEVRPVTRRKRWPLILFVILLAVAIVGTVLLVTRGDDTQKNPAPAVATASASQKATEPDDGALEGVLPEGPIQLPAEAKIFTAKWLPGGIERGESQETTAHCTGELKNTATDPKATAVGTEVVFESEDGATIFETFPYGVNMKPGKRSLFDLWSTAVPAGARFKCTTQNTFSYVPTN